MHRWRREVVLWCLLISIGFTATAQDRSETEIARRVDQLLAQMSIEEKAGQLNQLGKLNPQTLDEIRQGRVGSLLGVLGAQGVNRAQRAAVDESRLKIPLLFGYDVIH